ncbi:MAG: DUF418 domain-containing protein [Trueperaceae bacterium]|nr:DUF418 domain-containing protein [Trueperaceae bacterium]
MPDPTRSDLSTPLRAASGPGAGESRAPEHPEPPPRAFGPVAASRRIVTLDVLRGFALLGILLVNVPLMMHPVHLEALGAGPDGGLDRVARLLVEALAEGKFFTLFSLLFGVGMAIQMQRAASRGAPFVPFFLRRMGTLLGIGAAHVLLLWWGDILVYYAVLGMAVLPLRAAPVPRLLRLAGGAVLVPIALNAGLFGLGQLAQTTPEGAEAWRAGIEASVADARVDADVAYQTYGATDFGAMVMQRVADWSFATIGVTVGGMLFVVAAMFLIGMVVGRRGVLHDPGAHLPLLRGVRVWGGLVGVLGTATWMATGTTVSMEPTLAGLVSTTGFVLGAPALSLAYAATLTLALRDPRWQARLRPLAAVGRLALSNYLLQSLVVTTLAYGYGLGLYGQIGAAWSLVIALVVFALQVPLSVAWTRRFRYGPVEWLWRTLSYGRPPRPSA